LDKTNFKSAHLTAALEREKNLLAMLGQEQQSRREMEQKLLALPEREFSYFFY
jgi:uncharacterized membrane protein